MVPHLRGGPLESEPFHVRLVLFVHEATWAREARPSPRCWGALVLASRLDSILFGKIMLSGEGHGLPLYGARVVFRLAKRTSPPRRRWDLPPAFGACFATGGSGALCAAAVQRHRPRGDQHLETPRG